MIREFVICACILPFGADLAWSCPGQTGKVIFSDDFSDDSGGWDLDPHTGIVSGALQITADPKTQSDGALNSTFNATTGDYCGVIAFPALPPEDNNEDYAALVFLSSDYNNQYRLTVDTTGQARIDRKAKGNWQNLTSLAKVPSIKTDPGSENTLRVVVKDDKLTFFVNGTQIKVLRAQVTDDTNKFGFFAGNASHPPTSPRVSSVKSYSVTEAP
jgi:hypothetical protein